jgi:hypothetical protein
MQPYRTLCLLPRDVVDFVLATQPREWQKLAQHHGAAVKEQLIARVAAEIGRRGALDVLRIGIKDSGCAFRHRARHERLPGEADVDRFARIYFDRKATQDLLYQALAPVVERARALPEAEQRDFRGHLTDYVGSTPSSPRCSRSPTRIWRSSTCSRVTCAACSRRTARSYRERSSRISTWSPTGSQQTVSGRIALERKAGLLDPVSTKSDLLAGNAESPQAIVHDRGGCHGRVSARPAGRLPA